MYLLCFAISISIFFINQLYVLKKISFSTNAYKFCKSSAFLIVPIIFVLERPYSTNSHVREKDLEERERKKIAPWCLTRLKIMIDYSGFITHLHLLPNSHLERWSTCTSIPVHLLYCTWILVNCFGRILQLFIAWS